MTGPAKEADRGAEIVRSARSWIGTPYRLRASVNQAGADCLGLLAGVWRDILGTVPCSIPVYTEDWLETSDRDHLLDALDQFLPRASDGLPRQGRVLAFRFGRNNICKHVGIAAVRDGRPTFIHSYCRFGVVETTFDTTWRRRLAAAFEFPIRSI